MRSISFQRLHAENFKCYTNVTVDFTRFGPGCHSIRGVNKVVPRLGSNGAGKSTLWDALCFALYGKTTKRLRAGDVVPYGSNKNPQVTLDLAVDGQLYTIMRRAWPHGLILQTPGHVSMQGSQENINQLLGMDFDLFLHTIVLAQGQPLFLDLPPREKLALLSTVLNLDRFEDYSHKAKLKVSAIAVEAHTLQTIRNTVEGQLVEVERQIDEMKAKATDFEATKQANIEKLRTLRSKAERALGKAEAASAGAKMDRDAAELEWQDAYKELAEATAQRDLGLKLRMRVGRMTIGSDCPQCGQPVTKQAHQHLVQQAELLVEASDYDKLKQRHDRAQAMAMQARAEFDQASNAERTAYLDVTANDAAHRIATSEANPFTEQGSILAQRRHHLETRAKENDSRRAQLEQDRQTVEPWVEGFKDIRLIVLDDVLATLGVLTTSYANELGLPCTVAFAIDRTTKSGTVVNGIQMSVDAIEKLEAWSGGEAQRLRLAASLALSASLLVEAGLNLDLLALDEPSAHLSAEGLNELTQFLTSHAEAEGRRIFLTDQRRLNVDNTVTLTREAGNVLLA